MTKRGDTYRFILKALETETDDCIFWPFSKGSHGYGDFRKNGEHMLAHRFVCEKAHGDPPQNYDAAHSCGNKLCVNKRHLSWKNRAENLADKIIHGSHQFGERHCSAILSEEQVSEIRSSDASGAVMARRFGVHPNTIYAVRKNRSWRHLC